MFYDIPISMFSEKFSVVVSSNSPVKCQPAYLCFQEARTPEKESTAVKIDKVVLIMVHAYNRISSSGQFLSPQFTQTLVAVFKVFLWTALVPRFPSLLLHSCTGKASKFESKPHNVEQKHHKGNGA